MSKDKFFGEIDMTEPQDETAKKNHFSGVVGGIAAAMLVIVGVAMFGGKLFEWKEQEQISGMDYSVESEQESVQEDDVIQMEADVKHIFLTAHENLPIKEFNSAVEILKGRLDVLCEGTAYEMEVSGEMIKLTLPASVFGKVDLNQMMQNYISRKMEYFGYHLGTEKTDNPEFVAIQRSDFAMVTLENGTVDGFDASVFGEGINEYPYIKLVFADAFMEAHGEEIAAWGDQFVFAQDVENSSWWYYHLYPEGDGKTFYLVNADDGKRFPELLYYNLTHDSLAESFYYSTDINYDTVWEYVSLIDTPGEYQKNSKDITGKTLTIQYSVIQKPTEGEWFDLKAVLKKRLDDLGEPYAFGMLELEDDECAAVVKTSVAHMGTPVMELLSARKNDIAVVGGLEKKYVESLHYEKNSDGTYSVYASVAKHVVEELERILGEWKEEGIMTVYLAAGETEWLAGSIESYKGNGVLVFDRFCFGNGEPLTEEDKWLLGVLDEIKNGDDLPLSFVDKAYQLNEDENGNLADETDFMLSYSALSEPITKKIKEICREATVSVSDDTIYVSLHQNMDENFAKDSMELVKKIYQNCGFIESGFEGMTFYLFDEKNEIRERGRLFIQKTYGISANIPGYVYSAGVFANGRMEEYKEEFLNIVETDPFFTELVSPYGSNWQFEF